MQAPTTAMRDYLRAQIILRRTAGIAQTQVAAELGVSKACVNKWSQRFEREGLAGLQDRPGRGRRPSIAPATVEQVILRATQPPAPRMRWSVRTMAAAVGVSPDSVHRIWRANAITPHVVKTFQLSTDPQCAVKFWDVIGLYLDPPERALVLCCDEEGQCQALERTQPGLPLRRGATRMQTHDYRRHGTVTLFAALNYLDAKLIARTEAQHTHVECLRFLKQIDREAPPGVDLHLIVDNYCTRKDHRVRGWLARHARFHLHFTPTSAPWMTLVERFFVDLTQEVLREESFGSARALIDDIECYLADPNLKPTPYKWKAKGEVILRKLQRARAALAAQQETAVR